MSNPVIDDHGTIRWYLDGKYHREDGPAVELVDGSKYWYLNGKLHREDGPALEYSNGDKEWYLNGKEIYVNNLIDFQRQVNLIAFW